MGYYSIQLSQGSLNTKRFMLIYNVLLNTIQISVIKHSFHDFQVFNKTDNILTTIEEWPKLKNISFFKNKLNFQIQHSLFREKVSLILAIEDIIHRSFHVSKLKNFSNTLFSFQVRDGNKGIFEVLNWYNDINTKLLDYVSTSIRESDISSFYRYIIGFKNLMRSVEYCGKAGVWGLR